MDFVLWCRTSTVAQCQWHTGKGNLPPCYPHRLNTHIVFDICRLVCIASYNKYNYWTILYVFVWLLFLWFVSRWNRQNATRLFPSHVFRNWWANWNIEIKYDKEVVGWFFTSKNWGWREYWNSFWTLNGFRCYKNPLVPMCPGRLLISRLNWLSSLLSFQNICCALYSMENWRCFGNKKIPCMTFPNGWKAKGLGIHSFSISPGFRITQSVPFRHILLNAMGTNMGRQELD